MKMRTIGLLILSIMIQGCEKIYFPGEPDNSPVANFNTFWKDFSNYYGQFDIRHINWDSVYVVYHSRINAGSSEQDLYNVFDEMIQLLKDGHVNLYTPIGVAGYNKLFPLNYSGNVLIGQDKYIAFSQVQNSVIACGTVNSYNIGYIIIQTFHSNEFGIDDSRYNIIDDVIQLFKDKEGIIIDVRGNNGGNSSNALNVAARFADKRYLCYKQRYKIGPAKNDFSDWVNFDIYPQGKFQFTKPVVVLMSKYTFSAAELFVCAMSVFPNVKLVGDTTAGDLGDPVYRELMNGWSYRLSTSIGAMANGYIIDGKGIVPQFLVVTSQEDAKPENNRDPMLEKSIEVIENSK
jgi:carboxyl-terminal processing protease